MVGYKENRSIFLLLQNNKKGKVKYMNVAILGFGVVGSGVAEVISKNADAILENSGIELKLRRILDIRDFENNEFSALMTKNFDDICNDDEIDIVVETMGGINPAFDFVSSCLKKGKHVVTSNKELVAKKGFELLTLARENNVNFLFEASVGGGPLFWRERGRRHSDYPPDKPLSCRQPDQRNRRYFKRNHKLYFR